MKVLFLTRYGRLGASSRVRAYQYFPWLEKSGISCVAFPLVDDFQLAEKYQRGRYRSLGLIGSYYMRVKRLLERNRFDLVWIEKEALPWVPASLERFFLKGRPFMLDFDDAVFHLYDQHPSFFLRRVFGRKLDQLMSAADLVTTGNSYLAGRAMESGCRRVEIMPTTINLDRYTPKDWDVSSSSRLLIVWIGTPVTSRYLEILRGPLAALSRNFSFRLRVIGGAKIVMPGVEVESLPWSENTEGELIRQGDVGVMPLHDTDWERGKCGYKLIQYMACGLPVVASAVGANRDIVIHGENGFLPDSAQEWEAVLAQLLTDSLLRRKMGESGRRRVGQNYCVQQTSGKLVDLIRTAGGAY